MTAILERPRTGTQWAFTPLAAGSDSGADTTRQLVEALSADLGTGSNPVQWLVYCSHMSSTRSWSLFDREQQAPVLERRPVSDLVDTIRSAFQLSVTELASVLRVKRPTIYSWLKDNPELRPENEERLRLTASLADEWLKLVAGMRGDASLRGAAPSRDFVALLSSEVFDADGLRAALADEARAARSVTRRSRFREDLRSRVPRRSESNFDVATRRPLGPEPIR
jgi:DNA-binding transcriptional regulator YiaG